MPANPILYTFRRCPYAMRARLALRYSGIETEFREVALRNKPLELLTLSPKGTVPVLQLSDGRILEESLDIMRWALALHDPDDWLRAGNSAAAATMSALIDSNDGLFKHYLDRYKYADRHPQFSAAHYRTQGEQFLMELNRRLDQQSFLIDDRISLADMAILPFVRQFAHVDRDWFQASPYTSLNRWLTGLLDSPLFAAVMQK